MTPIQQLLLGQGAKKATYLDDVFNTLVYKGDSSQSPQVRTTGVNLADKGGLVWAKRRNGGHEHGLYDTERGVEKRLSSDGEAAEETATTGLKSFTSTGFTTAQADDIGGNGDTYAAWTFAKSKGFFDCIKYTGSGSNRTIAHSLGSVPGMIIIKDLSTTYSWRVYHRSLGATKYIQLNYHNASATDSNHWNDTEPTASVFSLGTEAAVNTNGNSYVAYIFAGNKIVPSGSSTARSVYFDGNTTSGGPYPDFMKISSTDLKLGTGSYTVEGWFKPDGDITSKTYIFSYFGGSGSMEEYGWEIFVDSNLNVAGERGVSRPIFGSPTRKLLILNEWNHIAVVRDANNSNKLFLYVNGEQQGLEVGNHTDDRGESLRIATGAAATGFFKGWVSNFRVTIGQALYTSNFKVPTEPLTTTSQGATASNVEVLICNNSSVTGGTAPATINTWGDPSASEDNPFDDPVNFAFGEDGDQNVITTGTYVGNGSDTAPPEIHTGWQPQWVMIKRMDGTGKWAMFDSMRGITTAAPPETDGDDAFLAANETTAETNDTQYIDLTEKGFMPASTDAAVNTNNAEYMYLCVRDLDAYVTPVPEVGTDAFTMDLGSSSSTIPEWDSGFPVAFGMFKKKNAAQDWYASSRLLQGNVIYPNTTDEEDGFGDAVFDSNVGWGKSSSGTYGSNYISYMFKKSKGFTTLTYKGRGRNPTALVHNMNSTPEMVWIKRRDYTGKNWVVGHIGLNGGTNPFTKYVMLNQSGAFETDSEITDSTMFYDTAPTSEILTLGSNNLVNANSCEYAAFLFSSVPGISKVGYYNGSNSTQTITVGFQPRVVWIKRYDADGMPWLIYDTVRGWVADSSNPALRFNSNGANEAAYGYTGGPTSTGFTLNSAIEFNASGCEYIYYCHS